MARGRKKKEVGQLDEEGRKLVDDHIDVVEKVAFFVGRGRGMDEDERKQIGLGALVEAAVRYDPDKGPFKPYALAWVRGAIKNAVAKLQPHLDARRGYTREEILAGKDRDGREITVEDFENLARDPLPIEQVIDPATTLGSKLLRAELKAIAHEVVDELSEGPRALLEALYFEEISMQEYAERSGLSAATISRHKGEVMRVVAPRLLRRLGGK